MATRIIVNKSWRVYIAHGRYNQTTTRMLSTNVSTQTVETEINLTKVYDWAARQGHQVHQNVQDEIFVSCKKNYPWRNIVLNGCGFLCFFALITGKGAGSW